MVILLQSRKINIDLAREFTSHAARIAAAGFFLALDSHFFCFLSVDQFCGFFPPKIDGKNVSR
jgi:hypothetical protein